jgi:hypothetical protein
MRKDTWFWVAALAWLSGSCCAHPGLFQKAQESVMAVQGFYDPLINQDFDRNVIAKQALVAADTTLLLASELQKQWCPNPNKAEQLDLQAQEAKQLAREAWICEAGVSQETISLKSKN